MTDRAEEFARLENAVMVLLRNLPENLFYHTIEHTLDVMREAMRIAESEQLGDEATHLLKIAALLHDSGFTRSLADHELNSCNIAREILPDYQLGPEEIEQVCAAILATRIPQTPLDKISEILCDADLDYLGRSDFFEIGDSLYKEMYFKGVLKNRLSWNELQVKFLKQHRYFTETNIQLRNPQKLKYLREIEEWLASKENDQSA